MENLTIAGRVGQDATIKDFNGNQYTAFSLAVDNSYKKQDGTKVEKTNWYNCLKSGTGIAPHIKKGQFLVVSGRPQPKLYKDQSGQTQISLNMLAEHITLGPNANPNPSANPAAQASPAVASGTAPSRHPSMSGQAGAMEQALVDDTDDDLPF